jgi:hypothetical protein
VADGSKGTTTKGDKRIETLIIGDIGILLVYAIVCARLLTIIVSLRYKTPVILTGMLFRWDYQAGKVRWKF